MSSVRFAVLQLGYRNDQNEYVSNKFNEYKKKKYWSFQGE